MVFVLLLSFVLFCFLKKIRISSRVNLQSDHLVLRPRKIIPCNVSRGLYCNETKKDKNDQNLKWCEVSQLRSTSRLNLGQHWTGGLVWQVGFCVRVFTKSGLALTILKNFLTFFKIRSCLHFPSFALCTRKWNIMIARIVCFPFIYRKDIFCYVQFSQDLTPASELNFS